MLAMADDRPRGRAAVGPGEEIVDDDELAAALAAELERIAPTGAVPVLRASPVPFGPPVAPQRQAPERPRGLKHRARTGRCRAEVPAPARASAPASHAASPPGRHSRLHRSAPRRAAGRAVPLPPPATAPAAAAAPRDVAARALDRWRSHRGAGRGGPARGARPAIRAAGGGPAALPLRRRRGCARSRRNPDPSRAPGAPPARRDVPARQPSRRPPTGARSRGLGRSGATALGPRAGFLHDRRASSR